MTFSEKLVRLRKREGLSQEELASCLEVSRQAVSRWEQGTAMPDAPNLVKLGQRFQVSLDWLLGEDQDWEEPQKAEGKKKSRLWQIAGWVVKGISLLSLLVLGILSSVFPATVMEAPAGAEWVRAYTGLSGFLKSYHLEWLFALCLLIAFLGLLLAAWPRLCQRVNRNPTLQTNLAWLAILLQLAGLYSCALARYHILLGQQDQLFFLWFSLALLLGSSIWMAVNLRREKDPRQRRKNSLIELGYCAVQMAAALLTAEGLGLVGQVLGVILYAVYVLVVNPRYMNRRLIKSRLS